MKKIVLILVLAVAALAGGAWYVVAQMLPAAASAAPLDPKHARIAGEFLDHLDAGRFDAADAMLHPDARAALAGGKLEEIWTTLPKQLGGLKGRSPLRGESVAGRPVVTSTLTFGMLSLDARVGIDGDGLIDGFRIVPAASATPEPAAMATTDRYGEREFSVGDGAAALPGTLTLPKGDGPFPAVVLVHGSGPQDRDSTLGPNKPFRDLAHGLAERGVAVLRYEKRTKARPQDFSKLDFTVDAETVDDAIAAVRQLRATEDIDPARVFVVGHSLGATMAPRIAQRVPETAGVVLLASIARPLQDVYLEQVNYLVRAEDDISADEQIMLDDAQRKAAAIATLAPDSPPADNLLGLPASYWIDLRGYDPIAVAQAIPQRMLVLQGERDYQVTPAGDFARWQAAFADVPRATLKAYPALNHLFIAGEGVPNPKEYFSEGRVAPVVIDDIAAWIGQR